MFNHIRLTIEILLLSILLPFSINAQSIEYTWLLTIIYKIGSQYSSSSAQIEMEESETEDIEKLREKLVMILDDNQLWKGDNTKTDEYLLINSQNKKPKLINNAFIKLHKKFEDRLSKIRSDKFTFHFKEHTTIDALEKFDENAENENSKADFSVNYSDCRLRYTGPKTVLPGAPDPSFEVYQQPSNQPKKSYHIKKPKTSKKPYKAKRR